MSSKFICRECAEEKNITTSADYVWLNRDEIRTFRKLEEVQKKLFDLINNLNAHIGNA